MKTLTQAKMQELLKQAEADPSLALSNIDMERKQGSKPGLSTITLTISDFPDEPAMLLAVAITSEIMLFLEAGKSSIDVYNVPRPNA